MSLRILHEKLRQLEEELEHTYQTVEQLLTKVQPLHNHIYCYFTYSIILNHMPSRHLIMGNFHIKNLSNQSMNSPVILLKITSKDEFNFTGKYKSTNQKQKGYNFHWERLPIKDLDPMTHYCFKPTKTDQLAPNEHLNFQNFQISIPDHATINVEGFSYFNKNNDGISAINSINISG